MNPRSLFSRLSSPVLALWLMGVLIVMNVLSVLVPQRGYLGSLFDQFAAENPGLASFIHAVGMDRIFGGWMITGVAALLAVNVTACTIRRAVRAMAPLRPTSGTSTHTASLGPEWGSADEYCDAVATELRNRRWEVVSDRGVVTGRRGRSGFLGSMVLHVSILVLIAGGALTSLTTFRGEMRLTEGQSVLDYEDAYLSVVQKPELGDAFTRAKLSVDSTEIGYDHGQVVSAVVKMRGVDAEGDLLSKDVRVNHPFDVSGKSYLLRDTGYAAEVAITYPDGIEASLVVNLTERTDRGWAGVYDVSEAFGERAGIALGASPVPVERPEDIPDELYNLTDPRLTVSMTGLESTRGVSATLREGESTEVLPGLEVEFQDLRLWHTFLVRGDPARWVTYVGFWLAVAGALWRFLVVERRIFVHVRESEGGQREVTAGLRSRPWSGFSATSDEVVLRELLDWAHSRDIQGERT